MNKSRDAFRTISEVADWLETPAHVLRFWESKFTQVKPVKRAGGRRYYRPGDMTLLSGIKQLLHEEGMTIKGVQKVLREKGVKHVCELSTRPLQEDALEDEMPVARVASGGGGLSVTAASGFVPPMSETASLSEVASASDANQMRVVSDTTLPADIATPLPVDDGGFDAPVASGSEAAPGMDMSDGADPLLGDAPADEVFVKEPVGQAAPAEAPIPSAPTPQEPKAADVPETTPVAAPVREAALPKFLQRSVPEVAAVESMSTQDATEIDGPSEIFSADASNQPVETAQPLADAPDADKQIQTPDAISATDAAVQAGTLSAVLRSGRLTDEQRTQVLPLVAKLREIEARATRPGY